jgi:dTMP kinase
MAHQGSKFPADKRQQYIDWIYKLEYEEMGIPKEDVVFFLDVSPDLARPHLKWRDGKDIHEEDAQYQEKTYRLYKEFSGKYGHWKHIQSVDSSGAMLTPEEIHRSIVKLL